MRSRWHRVSVPTTLPEPQSRPLTGNGAHAGMMYGEPLSPEQQQQAFLSRLLLMLGSFVIMCLLLF